MIEYTEHKEQHSCQYADELMAYLYDEIGDNEKSVFEFHLADCSSCADELASFSAVRFSIGEWRDLDFKTLETPSIINPAANVEPSFSARVENKSSLSLIAQIRELIGLSPAWMSAAAAALVVCFGLFLAVSYMREDSGSLALNETNQAEAIPTAAETVASETRAAQTAIETSANEKSKPPTVSPNRTLAEESPRTSLKTPAAPEVKPVRINEKIREKRIVRPNSKKTPAPSLIADEDDYEDESLRLSDIFRGVDGG